MKFRNIIQKTYFSNLLYTIGGVTIANVILQLIIFPLINKKIGVHEFGTILFLMGFVNIFAPSFGQGINNSRMVNIFRTMNHNGDYFRIVLIYGFGAFVITLFFIFNSEVDFLFIFGLFCILILTTFRYYSDIEFKINLNFKNYFFYFLILSFGYLFGYAIFIIFGNWFLVFIIGEFSALLFVIKKGTLFRKISQRTEKFSQIIGKSFILSLSYLLFNTSLQLDRIILKLIVDTVAVSEYFILSLIGKSLVLIIMPLNTLLISNLTASYKRITIKEFTRLLIYLFLGCVFFLIFCQLTVPIFIQIFYPEFTYLSKDLILIINLSQILSIATTTLLVVILTFTHEKWQLVARTIILLLFIMIAIPFTRNSGINGFSVASLWVNIFGILVISIFGLVKSR